MLFCVYLCRIYRSLNRSSKEQPTRKPARKHGAKEEGKHGAKEEGKHGAKEGEEVSGRQADTEIFLTPFLFYNFNIIHYFIFSLLIIIFIFTFNI